SPPGQRLRRRLETISRGWRSALSWPGCCWRWPALCWCGERVATPAARRGREISAAEQAYGCLVRPLRRALAGQRRRRGGRAMLERSLVMMAESVRACAELARQAEAAGFAAVWTTEF